MSDVYQPIVAAEVCSRMILIVFIGRRVFLPTTIEPSCPFSGLYSSDAPGGHINSPNPFS